MKIEKRQRGQVCILDLKGKLTIGAGDVALREAMQLALQASPAHILLNTREVATIDSSGIGELVAAFTSVANRGGKLKLLNLPPKLTDILQVTQLITVFEVFENEDEAIQSF